MPAKQVSHLQNVGVSVHRRESHWTNHIAPVNVVRNVNVNAQSILPIINNNVKRNVQLEIRLSIKEVKIRMGVKSVSAHVHHFHMKPVKLSATKKGSS